MIELVTDIAFGLLGLAMVLAVLRLILGPTLADRILALDLANTVGIGLIATFAVHMRQPLYIDVGISLALVGFVATVSLAGYSLAGGNR